MAKTEWVIFHLNFRGFDNWVETRDTWNKLVAEYSYQWLMETQRNDKISPEFGEGSEYAYGETLGAWFRKNNINPMP